jgi:palmitoyl-protein thioesterase
MGTDAVPHCFSGPLCYIINLVAKNAVYFKNIQKVLGPAGYFRDPKHMKDYLEDSVFLPYLNNEKQHDRFDLNKERFTKVNGMMLVMFNKDSMIYPPATAHFNSYDLDG